MIRNLSATILSLSLASQSLYAGQYQQQCEQAGKKSQQSCQGAAAAANAGDNAQAGAIGASVGASASANPGANGMMNQAGGQIGRLSSASNACQQAKKDCEQKCDQQKQGANGDQQARQKGEPGQVDQSKQSQCSKAMDAQIGPLLMALAAAMAALASAQQSEEKSDAGVASQVPADTTPISAQPAPAAPAENKGRASFAVQPQAMKTGAAAIEKAGGQITPQGVKLPDGSFHSWSSLAGGGTGGAPAGGATQASLNSAGPVSLPDSSGVSPLAAVEGSSSGASAAAFGGSESSDSASPFSGRAPANLAPKPAAAGLRIDYQGTPIGVKADDIFGMIHRAYDRKKGENFFFIEVEAPRAPAAVQKLPRWYQRRR